MHNAQNDKLPGRWTVYFFSNEIHVTVPGGYDEIYKPQPGDTAATLLQRVEDRLAVVAGNRNVGIDRPEAYTKAANALGVAIAKWEA